MNHKTPEWMERGGVLFDRITANGLTPWPSQREAFISGYGEGAIPANNRAAALEKEQGIFYDMRPGRITYTPANEIELAKLRALNESLFQRVQRQVNELKEMEEVLDKISKLDKMTMLCDPADFDFDAEEAFSAGATNAFCDAAHTARECLERIEKGRKDE